MLKPYDKSERNDDGTQRQYRYAGVERAKEYDRFRHNSKTK